ncbi:hypothetical protein P029_03580 [Anaplasma phagocytophilum str. Norway variant2]|uniref:Major facilitator superfamily (MFS) profile domain-containing protein n=2 Tax=Anaplasma phagocytophilum TaxID=948 RepID=A0A161IK84_ANAPH|nr:hypothetical protein P029_03580 [Anaplasma phagocytophilum str. Norway variant2]
MISRVITVGFGAVSDVIGRKKVMGGASIALFFLAIPVFWLLSQESFWYVGLGYFLFAIPFAATLGPSSAAMSELLPTKVRYTGFGKPVTYLQLLVEVWLLCFVHGLCKLQVGRLHLVFV